MAVLAALLARDGDFVLSVTQALLSLPAIDARLARLRALDEGARLLDLPARFLDVDVLRSHGVVDENDGAILMHLEVSRPGRERLPLPARAHTDLPRLQHRDKRRVPGEHADLAAGTGDDQHLGLALENGPLRRHDGEVEDPLAVFRSRQELRSGRLGLALGLSFGLRLPLLGGCLLTRHLLRLLDRLFDRADHVEGLLR
jgi:hypothetical protein